MAIAQETAFALLIALLVTSVFAAIARLGGTRPNWANLAGIAIGILLATATELGFGLEHRWHIWLKPPQLQPAASPIVPRPKSDTQQFKPTPAAEG